MIVGVNNYRLDNEDPIDIRDIDNAAVREAQIAPHREDKTPARPRTRRSRAGRLARGRRRANGNLLAAAVEAARARATVGEISDAMRGRSATTQPLPEVVGGRLWRRLRGRPEYLTLVSRASRRSPHTLGRTPRIMVAKLGQDGHDRGAKVIATAFADIGFDVLAGPLFQTPEEAADMAIATKVHVVGVSSLAAGHKTLVPQLVEALKQKGAGDIIVIVRRRHPAPGLRVPARQRRRRGLRPRHQRA